MSIIHPHTRTTLTSTDTDTDPGTGTRTGTRTGIDTTAAQAVGVTKAYGAGDSEVRALDDVSVDIETGRFTAIMGPSGSG